MKLKSILGCFVFLFAVISCKSTKPTVTQSDITTKVTTQLLHDTIFKIEKDSSAYKALLDCQNGKVVIKQVDQTEPGRILKSPKVRIENNQLQVDCEARAHELLAHYKNTEVKEVEIKTNTITQYINQLTFWQQFQIKGFRILMGLILLFACWSITKNYLKL